MRLVFTLLALSISMIACSNPFSNKKASVLTENSKPKNESCAGVHFDQSEINPKQFKAVIQCLNQNHEVEAINSWASSLRDEELKPLTEYFSSIIKKEPEFIYSLKELYVQMNNDREFQPFLDQLLNGLKSSQARFTFVKSIEKHSKWIQKFIANNQYRINFQNLIILTKLRSFERLKIENLESLKFNVLLEIIIDYRNHSDALTFQEIFDFFSDARSEILTDKNKAEKLAGFLNWLFEENRLQAFSKAAESLNLESVSCFDHNLKLNEPLTTLLSILGEVKPSESMSYFQKNIPSILILGKSYCGISPKILFAAEILQQGANQAGFGEFFELIQPLFKNPRFQSLLQSSSFKDLVPKLSSLNKTHLFQDLITLRNWFKTNPVIEGNVPGLLDSILKEYTKEDISFFTGIIPNDDLIIKILQKFILKTPVLRTSKLPAEQNWIAPFGKSSFSGVLEQTIKMNEENKISPILGQIIIFFDRMLESGRIALNNKPIPKVKLIPLPETSNWLLQFTPRIPIFAQTSFNCDKTSLHFDFFKYDSVLNQNEYFLELEKLSACYGGNRSFASLKDLIKSVIQSNDSVQNFSKINHIQSEALAFLIISDYGQALQLFESFIKFDRIDLKQIKSVLQSSSRLFKASKTELKSAVNLRKIAGKYLSKIETYKAILVQDEWSTPPVVDSAPELSKSLFELVLKTLPKIFTEHCKSLTYDSRYCLIDRDQVELYLKSPSTLASQIVSEYLDSFQSWIHPKDSSEWKTIPSKPNNVATIEYHFNPLIHQLDHQSNAIQGAFSFIKRNAVDGPKIANVLNDWAFNFRVIPYFFQNGDYPDNRYEFRRTMRIRVLNDLDRLELLAINSDFKPFGWIKNFGMNFIREIATSWGDVPINQRPKFSTSETLAQARYSILKQYNRYNSQIIERFGNCLSYRVCNAELSDIHARLFNLGFMLDLMDKPDNMVFFRDLFYSFYEKNTDQQRDLFINGIKDQVSCTDSTTRNDYCISDLLHLIPRITRMGLLHQTGLAISKSNKVPTESVIKILNQIVLEKHDLVISDFLSSTAGIKLLRGFLAVLLNTDKEGLSHLSSSVDSLSKLDNLDWFNFVSKILIANPELIDKYLPTIQFALDHLDFKSTSPEIAKLISSVAKDMNQNLIIDETLLILDALSDSQSDIQLLISTRITPVPAKRWLEILSEQSNQKSRDRLSSWMTGNWFDHFCDVYTDAQTVNKAYNFLEESNQNSGVFELIEECRRFLH